jgi:hypothetical protein
MRNIPGSLPLAACSFDGFFGRHLLNFDQAAGRRTRRADEVIEWSSDLLRRMSPFVAGNWRANRSHGLSGKLLLASSFFRF